MAKVEGGDHSQRMKTCESPGPAYLGETWSLKKNWRGGGGNQFFNLALQLFKCVIVAIYLVGC